MRERCSQCLIPILGFGHETPKREVLCGPCYSAIWGPGGEQVLAATDGGRESGDSRPRRWWRKG